ncbi:MAG TPA: hypothetical protein VEK07_16875 [Polyangiaceae bacterium]|nr:hypothetical protein [Polyangiaceae bacterium]
MNGSTVGALVLFLASAAGVAGTQPRLAALAHSAKESEDVYVLPPPAPLHVATLGWDAAAVDLLWASLMVDYGTHWSEHREFKDVPRYLDAILELEPSFWLVYQYADTILAYRPLQGTEEDARRARAYLERGTRERPNDSRVWFHYGQFLAFMGPSFLHDPQEADAWRVDGASALGHAVDLGGGAEVALSAATILTRKGAREQAIAYLRRAYVFTEGVADVHETIGRRLVALETSAWNDVADAARAVIDARWKREMPFVAREQYILLGPRVAPFGCQGIESADDPSCARDWSAVLSQAQVTRPESSVGSP